MTLRPNRWLLLAAACDFAISLLHVVIAAIGSRSYLYFGASGLARLANEGSAWPAVFTLLLAVVFAVFGLYALSAGGWGRRLPLVTAALMGISAIYCLRGLILILDLLRLATGAGYPLRQTVISFVALSVGLAHLLGTLQTRRAARG